jgi:hypothetical protein
VFAKSLSKSPVSVRGIRLLAAPIKATLLSFFARSEAFGIKAPHSIFL